LARTKLTTFVVVGLFAASSVSCGSGGAPDETGNGQLAIDSAEWRAAPEPTVRVSGQWSLGISTPPACSLLEGKNGDRSDWYDRTVSVELDGGEFYQKFVRDPEAGVQSNLDPETEYYVRCRTSGDTGRTAEAVAPVGGEVPSPQRAEENTDA
jgi:hypothetical protein